MRHKDVAPQEERVRRVVISFEQDGVGSAPQREALAVSGVRPRPRMQQRACGVRSVPSPAQDRRARAEAREGERRWASSQVRMRAAAEEESRVQATGCLGSPAAVPSTQSSSGYGIAVNLVEQLRGAGDFWRSIGAVPVVCRWIEKGYDLFWKEGPLTTQQAIHCSRNIASDWQFVEDRGDFSRPEFKSAG